LLDYLRREGKSTATIAAVWKTLVRIVNYGRGRDLLTLDLTLADGDKIQVRNARKVYIPSADESNRVIDATPEDWRTLVEFLRSTGARVSEGLGLQVQDVDFNTGAIRIERQLDREGGVTSPKTLNGVRAIVAPERLRVALLARHNANEDKSPTAFLFGQHTQRQGRYRLAARALAKAIRDAGIEYDAKAERFSFHSFRHGIATALIARNIDPQTVADHLGDDVATILSTYVHSNGGAETLAAVLEEVAA
jgi:integrase